VFRKEPLMLEEGPGWYPGWYSNDWIPASLALAQSLRLLLYIAHPTRHSTQHAVTLLRRSPHSITAYLRNDSVQLCPPGHVHLKAAAPAGRVATWPCAVQRRWAARKGPPRVATAGRCNSKTNMSRKESSRMSVHVKRRQSPAPCVRGG
jgi:hypothetical protein